MAHYRASITVPSDIETTFDYLSQFDNVAEWDPGVRSAASLTPSPAGLGSRFDVVAVFLGRAVPMQYEIVDFFRPARVVLRASNSYVESIDTIDFTSADGGGTTVQYDALLRPLGLARLAAPIFHFAFGRIGDRAVVGLEASLVARHESLLP